VALMGNWKRAFGSSQSYDWRNLPDFGALGNCAARQTRKRGRGPLIGNQCCIGKLPHDKQLACAAACYRVATVSERPCGDRGEWDGTVG